MNDYDRWYEAKMNVPRLPTQVRVMNRLLEDQLGSTEGFPTYQWKHYLQLFFPMALFATDSHGRTITLRDFLCACGKNKIVHDPRCKSLIVPVAQWELRPLAPRQKDKWTLCCWQPPANPKDWAEIFGGTVPYPSNGYYAPVSAGAMTVSVDGVPERDTTEEVIRAVKEQRSISLDQRERDWHVAQEKEKEQRIASRADELKNSFTVFDSRPGEKGSGSFGGVGESPVLRRLELPKDTIRT